MPVPHCFDFCAFAVNFEIRKYDTSNLFIFLKTILAIWEKLIFNEEIMSLKSKIKIMIFIIDIQ